MKSFSIYELNHQKSYKPLAITFSCSMALSVAGLFLAQATDYDDARVATTASVTAAVAPTQAPSSTPTPTARYPLDPAQYGFPDSLHGFEVVMAVVGDDAPCLPAGVGMVTIFMGDALEVDYTALNTAVEEIDPSSGLTWGIVTFGGNEYNRDVMVAQQRQIAAAERRNGCLFVGTDIPNPLTPMTPLPINPQVLTGLDTIGV